MTGLEFLSKLIDSLAWPSAIILLFIFLREPIKKLIPAIKKFRYRGLELDFAGQMRKMESLAQEANLPPSGLPKTLSQEQINDLRFWTLQLVAATSPESAIIHSWKWVENQLYSLFPEDEGEAEPEKLFTTLRPEHEKSMRYLHGMMKFMSKTIQEGKHIDLDTDIALDYVDIASRMSKALREYRKDLNSPKN